MKDWFHAILEHLYKTYPLDHSFHIINDFLQSEFNIDNVDGNDLHRLSAILSILNDKKYTEGLPMPKDGKELTRGQVIGFYIPDLYQTRNSLITHNVNIRLTIDGFVYMQNRDIKMQEHKSIILTNDLIRKNTVSQKLLTITSLIIAGVSASFILATVVIASRDETSDNVESVSKQLQYLNTRLQKTVPLINSMQKTQIRIDSSLKTMAKNSSKKK